MKSRHNTKIEKHDWNIIQVLIKMFNGDSEPIDDPKYQIEPVSDKTVRFLMKTDKGFEFGKKIKLDDLTESDFQSWYKESQTWGFDKKYSSIKHTQCPPSGNITTNVVPDVMPPVTGGTMYEYDSVSCCINNFQDIKTTNVDGYFMYKNLPEEEPVCTNCLRLRTDKIRKDILGNIQTLLLEWLTYNNIEKVENIHSIICQNPWTTIITEMFCNGEISSDIMKKVSIQLTDLRMLEVIDHINDDEWPDQLKKNFYMFFDIYTHVQYDQITGKIYYNNMVTSIINCSHIAIDLCIKPMLRHFAQNDLMASRYMQDAALRNTKSYMYMLKIMTQNNIETLMASCKNDSMAYEFVLEYTRMVLSGKGPHLDYSYKLYKNGPLWFQPPWEIIVSYIV